MTARMTSSFILMKVWVSVGEEQEEAGAVRE